MCEVRIVPFLPGRITGLQTVLSTARERGRRSRFQLQPRGSISDCYKHLVCAVKEDALRMTCVARHGSPELEDKNS